MEQQKNYCRMHKDYYSLQCKECQQDMKYNYMYNSECNKCKGQLAFQAFTKRSSLQCKECQQDMKYNYMYNSECNKCKGQLAFQAFTKRSCSVCKKEDEHHNGNPPTICIDCIKPYQCRKCGDKI